MGIPGIYQEIGPGERIALAKLAIEKLEQAGRPLRIAIDISIWQFQHQAGRGGSNPALRTLYYRVLRLLSFSIQPIFVFDGPNKPPIKRNKRTGDYRGSVSDGLTKQTLELFGLPIHTAPGEAEAECALLQREGIVDAVLSEDVDTLMFGCGLTLRNWSSESRTGSHPPTHVSAYDAKKTKAGKSGLDREGMILVALLSGGDYNTEGVTGCGIKVACEAARAGFGKSLCRISQSDAAGMDRWRQNLTHELQTNESKYFRTKHKALKIPEDFPDRKVLGYYTHPVVSSPSRIKKLKDEICWNKEVDIAGLRDFVSNAFNWVNKIGAKKFIRGLAPALLIMKLRQRSDQQDTGREDVIFTAKSEMELVKSIAGQRTHLDTDGIPELRVVYSPIEIVGLDLDAEPDDEEIDYCRDGLAPLDEDGNIESYLSDDVDPQAPTSPSKRKGPTYDPTKPDRLWIPETIVKLGVPLKVQDYAESRRGPKVHTRAGTRARKEVGKGGMPKGAIEKFVQVSKHNVGGKVDKSLASDALESPAQQPSPSPANTSRAAELSKPNTPSIRDPDATRTRTTKASQGTSTKPKRDANPWTLSQKLNSSQPVAQVTKPIARQRKPSSPIPFEQRGLDDSVSPRPSGEGWSGPPPSKPPPTQRCAKSSVTSSIDVDSDDDDRAQHLPQHTARSPGWGDEPSSRKIRKPTARVFQSYRSEEVGNNRSPSPDLPAPSDIFTRDPSSASSSKESQELQVSGEPEAPIDLCSSPGRSASPHQAETVIPVTTSEAGELTQAKNGKKYIMLRESLPGSWKIVNEADFASTAGHRSRRNRAWRMSGVERIDLTED
ncbi:hypothetical protein F5884DRAFT_33930 [Xylogone sp. PMI_703]|nr:hypothetical protein F5884DRAFT_33930 [Xylogone sp. PMI_703]